MTFDDIAAWSEYDVGDVIESEGGTILVGGDPSTRTSTLVLARTAPGETGNELQSFSDRELVFQLPHTMSLVSFEYENSGGTHFVNVNGDSSPIVREFGLLDGMMVGGVDLSVTGITQGIFTLTGPIESLIVSGQELAIDNVSLVPEPASLALLLFAGLTVSTAKKRVNR